ncbi:MAG: DNA topoisomerase IV subunit B [Mycoplasmoidaceae bacterium]|nr:MAG: DNA topoisomerase IV subunit B [Mycoplasmoidaceae bacterium]
MANQYKDDDIKVLSGLEHVRKRPGMYIGSTDITGMNHLIWEIFDNSIDEVISGNASSISVTLKKDNSVIVEDNGRGIPTGKNKTTGISTIDTVFTVLNAGGKFDDAAYKSSGGLHGVGASVTNALSEWLVVEVAREGKIWQAKYKDGGKIVQEAKEIGSASKTGTRVHFLPDPKIFNKLKFIGSIIEERIRESSFLYKGLKIIFKDEMTGESKTFISKNGISEYVEYVNEGKTTLHPIIYIDDLTKKIEVEIALQYTTANNDIIISFANSVKTREGGSHETSLKANLTEAINVCARKWNLLKEKDKNFEGDDIREGLTAVISVRVPESLIQYEGQTKNKLFTPEAKTAVTAAFYDKFIYWMEQNKKQGEKIIHKALISRDARLAARKAREDVKALKNTGKLGSIKSSKLTPAQSRDYDQNELFLVEGDSAGGTAKLARDKIHQAILPLRGKVINVEKAKLKDLLANEEIITIIACAGTGISSEFKIANLKYNKIIIMTDADVDGSHIQILLLTFFYRFMKPLIEKGHVFIAMPPLFKFTNTHSKQSKYIWDEKELEEERKKAPHNSIQRYKGLGEMNFGQLKETTMDKATRQLIQVSIEDAALAERRVSELMGDNAAIRKTWIDANVDFSAESE